jgi:hypothetical protein
MTIDIANGEGHLERKTFPLLLPVNMGDKRLSVSSSTALKAANTAAQFKRLFNQSSSSLSK